MPPRTKSAADLEAEIARLQAQLAQAQSGQPTSRRGGGRRSTSSANGKLPFPEFNDIKTAERTAARHILRGRTPAQLRNALTYEKANANRKVVLDLIQEAIDRNNKAASSARAAAPAAGRSRRQASAPAGDLPFRDFDKLASGKQTQSRAILAKQDIATLEATLAYEKANQNRTVLVSIIETQLNKKRRAEQAAPAAAPTRARTRARAETPAAAAPAADRVPFRGYKQIQSQNKTQARKMIARRDLETLRNTLTYERAHENRKGIVDIIETQIRKQERAGAAAVAPQPAAAPAAQRGRRQVAQADGLPFPGYDQVQSGKQTEARAMFAARDLAELEAAVSYEKAHQNRKVILSVLETQLRKKQRGASTAPAPTEAPAAEQAAAPATDRVPFRGYNQIQSGKQTEARAQFAKRDLATLQASLAYEKAHQNRKVIVSIIETQIRKQERQAAAPAPTPAEPAAAVEQVAAPAADRVPFRGYKQIQSQNKTQARKMLAGRDVPTLERTLAYERSHENRKGIIDIIETQLRKKQRSEQPAAAAPAAADADQPFVGYERIQSGKQTEARKTFAAKDLPTLQASLAYEKAHQNRKVIVSIIETQIRKQERQAGQAPAAAAPARPRTPAAPAADLPFPGFENLQSQQQTEARAILADQDEPTLHKTLAYERAHENRKVIVKVIETQIRKKQRRAQRIAAAAPEQAPAPAAAAETLPFRTFNQLRSSDRKAAQQILGRRSADELRATIAYEQAHRNRTIIVRLAEQALEAKTAAEQAARQEAEDRAARRQGRPTRLEQPDEWVGTPPLAAYTTWSLTAPEDSRNTRIQVAAMEDADMLKRLIDFEKAQPKPRSTILNLLIRRHRAVTGAGAANGPRSAVIDPNEKLPFPEYGEVQSSQQTQSRKLLNKQDLPTLERTLAFEQSHGGRVQVLDMIEASIKRKSAEQDPLPFPEFPRLASSRQRESKEILRSKNAQDLEKALAYEHAHAKRVQIIRLIEEAQQRLATGDTSDLTPLPERTPIEGQPFDGYETLQSSKQTESRRLLAKQDIPTLERTLVFEREGFNRKQIIGLIESQLRRKQGQPATPRAAAKLSEPAPEMPFDGYENVASSRQPQSREILAQQDVATLQRTLEFEKAHQNRGIVIGMIETQIRRKSDGTQRRARRTTTRAQAPAATQAAQAAEATTNGNLPFPGYDQVASSRRTESRAILVGQDVDTLRTTLAYEQAHQNRGQVKDLIETIIRQKESGKVRASRRTGGEPLPDYDNLPTKVVVEAISQGTVDSKLDQILAYERDHGGRADVIRACQERLAIPRDEGQIVSPTGRVWKGREPWRGYGTLDHNDKPVLTEAFKQRSSGELRRVEQAEGRQDFPSQTAIDAAKEILAERERQPVSA